MNLLSSVITYVRRLIKSPSNAEITDNLIIDYINRFWLMDVDAEIQVFDLKTKYQFQTQPAVDQYNMPLYNVQSETPGQPNSQDIAMFPVYQGFLSPAYINGIQVQLQTEQEYFYNIWPNIVQNMNTIGIGNGTAGPYTLRFPIISNFPFPPNPPLNGILRGHVDIAGIIATGNNVDPPLVNTLNLNIPSTSVDKKVFITSTDATGANVVVSDSGQFLQGHVNHGLLMVPGNAPFGNTSLGTYSVTENTIDYLTGFMNVLFPVAIPIGRHINAQCFYFQTGLPRGILFYNNSIILRSPPDRQYLVELTAYLTPTAFMNTSQAIPYAYMSEYIARGAARKILSDTGDWEQFNAYEPLFIEQRSLVWKRSQRIKTSTRTQTIFSAGNTIGNGFYGSGSNSI
jgi:hypothetical protein